MKRRMLKIRKKVRRLFTNRTALSILLAALILLALLLTLITDTFGLRSSLARMIYGETDDDGGNAGESGGVPNMTRPIDTGEGTVAFDFSSIEILRELIPVENYTRVIRTINQWDGQETISLYTLTVNGSRWELSGAGKTAFCDGEHTYVSTDGYASVTAPDPLGFQDELGITTLDMLYEKTKNPAYQTEITVRGQTVRVSVTWPEDGIYEQYDISIENGLVLAETSSYWGVIYRSVTTNAMAVRMEETADDLRFAALRKQFYEDHPELLLEAAENNGGNP